MKCKCQCEKQKLKERPLEDKKCLEVCWMKRPERRKPLYLWSAAVQLGLNMISSG